MAAEGKVGPGSQNNWKDTVMIYETDPAGGTPFTKKNPTGPSNRKHSECWTADTPVVWDTNVSDAQVSIEDVGVIPDMLVSRDSNGDKEYHPLITFYNEVMARLMQQPGLKNKLRNLKNKQNAIDVWEYLEKTYL